MPHRDPRLSFDRAVDAYDEARPTYPVALFEDLFALLPPAPSVLEVGPGTGNATRDLLACGAFVHAVEIGPMMAARLRSNLPHDRLRVVDGDFERVGAAQLEVTPGTCDAVFSATAYHWITPGAQTDRPAELLRPGGLVAIVDLIQVDSHEDGDFFAAIRPIHERYGQGHRGPPAPARDAVDPPMRRALDRDERYGPVSVRRYDWDQTYTAARYRQLMLSYSGTQQLAEPQRAALLDEVESMISERFGGSITRPLVVTLTTAALREGSAHPPPG
ncbi:MAG: methyltransferase domain-containing protein [Nakamurella sp.]